MGDYTPVNVTAGTKAQPILMHELGTIGGDNDTPAYLYFDFMPPGLQWVFPYTYGFLFPLPVPLPKQQTVRIQADQTPAGFPTAPSSTALANLTAFEDQLPFSPGTRFQTQPGPQALLGTIQVPSGGSVTQNFPIPPGIHSIAVMLHGAASVASVPTQVLVAGHDTGAYYLNLPAVGSIQYLGSFFVSAAFAAEDASLDITISTTVGGTTTYGIYAILDASAVFVVNKKTQPLAALLVNADGSPLGDTSPDAGQLSVPAAGPTPLGIANWDYDAHGTAAPAAGSLAQVVLAATPGKAYHVAMLDAGLIQNGATAGIGGVVLFDGATVILNHPLGVDGTAGHTDHLPNAGKAFLCGVGNSVTFQFGAGMTTVFQRVNIGAYLR